MAESFQLKNYVFKQNQKMVTGRSNSENLWKAGRQKKVESKTPLECWAELPRSLRRWRKCRGNRGDTEQP